jgi:hypothetical protein
MAPDLQQEEIFREIERHRRAIAELEAKLAAAASQRKSWPPTGFSRRSTSSPA